MILDTSEQELVYSRIILDFNPVSSLVLFILQTKREYEGNLPINNNIFWRDKFNDIGSGPFPTVNEAVEHYKVTVLNRGQFKPSQIEMKFPLDPNVVDFIAFKAKRKTPNKRL